MSKLIPYAHAKSVYDIDIDFFSKLNLKYIFFDLDNTLDIHSCKDPSQRAVELMKDIKSIGITPIIISNNKESRVKRYADQCGVHYMYRTFKPFPWRLNKFMKRNNIKHEDVVLIGDQLLTDVRCAKYVGIRCILTEKLKPTDQLITKFYRWVDEIKRSRLMKENLLVDWRTIYGSIK